MGKMTAGEKLALLDRMRKALSTNAYDDIKTRRKVLIWFEELKEDISYQKPMKPINVSEDGHKFTCPRCKTAFESEDTVDQFNGCYVCLQRWRNKEKEKEDEN